ncbi:hypothetical protein [Flavobacterium hungaricum]|uniref:Uncharacterized protein n=1 Tax=Flavobacterium hungaricum TaxID=2082725 RepID=A0ABR9TR66_9FLAO|nr:hypothetical protein [Flavobacterium hungaricum]MBE8727254.1 hypothetical protein [Flavobacterium hungaricum]
MKKKLEADLISIAHRILKLKNKSDINQLYLETQKLYEKLAVLKFVEENFDAVKPTIGQAEIESQIETIFEKDEIIDVPAVIETAVKPEEVLAAASIKEEITETPIEQKIVSEQEAAAIEEIPTIEIEAEVIEEPVTEIKEEPIAVIEEPIVEEVNEPIIETKEEIKSEEENSFRTFSELKPIPDFKPAFELETEEIKEVVKEEPKTETSPIPTILFEDFGLNYADAQFVKVDSIEAVAPAPSISEFKEKTTPETSVTEKPAESKTVTLNERLARGFHVDLNDRIAFTKNLFGNSTEDYSRVLNQLLTFDSFSEAKDFIENMVKPDYNNWEGKDDYAERFLGIIEKKFA